MFFARMGDRLVGAALMFYIVGNDEKWSTPVAMAFLVGVLMLMHIVNQMHEAARRTSADVKIQPAGPGYTGGKNTADLRKPEGMKNPPPSATRPQPQPDPLIVHPTSKNNHTGREERD